MRKVQKPGNYFNIFNFADKNSWPVSLLVKLIQKKWFYRIKSSLRRNYELFNSQLWFTVYFNI